ncbi:ATP-binding protein [Psychromonas aquatilis]|uniref:histidine kinase n=1 Tax=Psychromonas aquatilis TaxID=2005072 RepID=A0ABU9GRC1_9GAMM
MQRVIKKINKRLKQQSLLITILAYLFSLFAATHLLWEKGLNDLQITNQQQLDRFTRQLNTELGHFKFVPQLLSRQGIIINALLSSDNSAQLDLTNRHLQSINEIVNSSDIYLIDKQGNTIAASNWTKQDTFIGDNYAFRPYFQEAIAGNDSQYFALGSTSGQRGYYFASPVRYAAEVIGVVVVKMVLHSIEKDWIGKQQAFLVTDNDNIVFISSKKQWLFHSLTPLSKRQLSNIKATRRYLDKSIPTLPLLGDINNNNSLVGIPDKNRLSHTHLSLFNTSDINHWTVRVVAPIYPILIDILLLASFISLLYILMYVLYMLLKQKRNRHKEQQQLAIKSKQKLELTVMRRTAALHAEIQERHKAEAALRATQKELIQSAKLAVLGQLSTSISHELNNPLSAIRSYAENAILFLERDKLQQVSSNLTRISLLTERMAKISAQLKSFARKSNGKLQVVELQPVIVAAYELLKPQLKENKTKLNIDSPEQAIYVKAEAIQLEQIIVNLLSNAMQSMQDKDDKLITLRMYSKDKQAYIEVLDQGTGIDEDDLPRLFDPFFTTKKTGLGLGLSISQQIINNMQGTLSAKNRSPIGAQFTITLPVYSKKDSNINKQQDQI